MEPPADLTADDLAELAHLFGYPDLADALAVENCAICQAPLDTDTASLSRCTHRFHADCIQNWETICHDKGKCMSCPVCRAEPNDIVYSAEHLRDLQLQIETFLNDMAKAETIVPDTESAKRQRIDAIYAELRLLRDKINASNARLAFYAQKIPDIAAHLVRAGPIRHTASYRKLLNLLNRCEKAERDLAAEHKAMAKDMRALRREYKAMTGRRFGM